MKTARFRGLVLAACLCSLCADLDITCAQNAAPADSPPTPPTTTPDDAPEPAPDKVGVTPTASDEQIQQRLIRILRATGWFAAEGVTVDEGVVFLTGTTQTDGHRQWAGDLARSTEDVVAVVNRIEVTEPSVFDFAPAVRSMLEIWRTLVRGIPWILFSLAVICLSYAAARLTRRTVSAFLMHRWQSQLLRSVTAFTVGLVVFLIGLYLVLRVAGLTQLAFTILGGTGLVGIVLGIGFRDITENFLASILLSWHNPFHAGDLIEVEGVVGYVERMTIRSTVLMMLNGNHVQIPNSIVYKSTIYNYTSNPNRREDFLIGIDYAVPIRFAQDVALAVLMEHPAVVKDPEPWVLVDGLESSSVNLRIYFWLNGHEHSWLKVKSSVIRRVKRAFQDHQIGVPVESREIVFPQDVPVRLLQPGEPTPQVAPLPTPAQEAEVLATTAEGGLSSDASDLQHQSRLSRSPEEGVNLLAEPMEQRSMLDG